MTPIPRQLIILGDRERISYTGIEALGQSILDTGLIEPIVLKPLDDGTFLLLAGGRRTRTADSLGITEFHLGASCRPGIVGCVLADSVPQNDPSADKLIEIIENLHRVDLDWREEVSGIAKAWKLRKADADAANERLYYGTFGAMVGGYNHTDINAALKVHEELILHPEKFTACSSILSAYKVLLDESKDKLQAELVKRSMTVKPLGGGPLEQAPQNGQPTVESEAIILPPIPLSSHFTCGDSYKFLECGTFTKFNAIVCDPDYALDEETLDSRKGNTEGGVAKGIAQEDASASLAQLLTLFPLAFNALTDPGWLVLFYDLSHHEKLQAAACAAGFTTQRWPCLWVKTGPTAMANGAPSKNFPKSYEPFMLCRKGQPNLTKAQLTPIISAPNELAKSFFGHPFAKPVAVWQFIYDAILTPGQSVFDPFMGGGSSAVAALQKGLVPYGCELQPRHFNNALLNIQRHHLSINANTTFA